MVEICFDLKHSSDEECASRSSFTHDLCDWFFFLVMVVIGWNFIVRISNRKLGSVWSLLYIIWIIAIKGYFLFSGKLDDWVIIWTFSGLLIYDQWLINSSLWIKYKREFPMPVSELFLFLTTNLYFSKQHCVQHFLRWH